MQLYICLNSVYIEYIKCQNFEIFIRLQPQWKYSISNGRKLCLCFTSNQCMDKHDEYIIDIAYLYSFNYILKTVKEELLSNQPDD